MSGSEFRRMVKRLHKQGVITELYKRGYMKSGLIEDVELAERYRQEHITYRALAKQIGIDFAELWRRIRRVS